MKVNSLSKVTEKVVCAQRYEPGNSGVYGYFACMYICTPPAFNASKGQKRVLDSLELLLVPMWVLGTQFGSSPNLTTESSLQHLIILLLYRRDSGLTMLLMMTLYF